MGTTRFESFTRSGHKKWRVGRDVASDLLQFTTSKVYPAGAALSHGMGMCGGRHLVVSLDFTVLSDTKAPPNGSLIMAVVSVRANSGWILPNRGGEHALPSLRGWPCHLVNYCWLIFLTETPAIPVDLKRPTLFF
jgi:hypothetical protein